METNVKVENAFKKLEEKLIVHPTSHDMENIKRAMQQMYDLGHADGYADYIHQHTVEVEFYLVQYKLDGVPHSEECKLLNRAYTVAKDLKCSPRVTDIKVMRARKRVVVMNDINIGD